LQGFKQFLRDPSLSGDAREDEIEILKRLRFNGKRPTSIGNTTKRSRVLTGEETDVNPGRVLEVPMDFKDAFDKDTEGAVRDYAGISTLAIRPYIVRRDLIAAMFEAAQAAGLDCCEWWLLLTQKF
jgi:hypothetical protein